MMLLFLRHFVGKKRLGTERERERRGTWRPKLSRELTLLSHPTYKKAWKNLTKNRKQTKKISQANIDSQPENSFPTNFNLETRWGTHHKTHKTKPPRGDCSRKLKAPIESIKTSWCFLQATTNLANKIRPSVNPTSFCSSPSSSSSPFLWLILVYKKEKKILL